jgi:hypothetical protein
MTVFLTVCAMMRRMPHGQAAEPAAACCLSSARDTAVTASYSGNVGEGQV